MVGGDPEVEGELGTVGILEEETGCRGSCTALSLLFRAVANYLPLASLNLTWRPIFLPC